MPNKHYLSESDTSHAFPQKRHTSAPSRYTPIQAPQTPLYSPITQAPSPISPSRDDDMMMLDKPEHGPASPVDVYESALLTPQETKRSTESPPAMFQSPVQSRPASLDGRLAELAQKFLNTDMDLDMMEDESDDDLGSEADLSTPKALMTKYFNQTDLNPDVIVLKATIEMLRKRRQQCLTDIGSLSRMKETALARPDRFAARVVAASRGAQKTSVHQGKHHWKLEENGWETPGPLEIPRVPEFEWAKYGVPYIYKNPDSVVQTPTIQPVHCAYPSASVQEMINPNSTRMTTRAVNSARSAANTKPVAQQGFNIRTGLDMVTRQKKNNLMSYSNPFMNEFNPTARQGRLLSVGEEAIEFLKTFINEDAIQRAERAVPAKLQGARSSRSDREIIGQALDDTTDVNTPISSGIRSKGTRYASMPAKLGGNTMQQRSGREFSEMETPSTTSAPKRYFLPRRYPASAFSSRTALQKDSQASIRKSPQPRDPSAPRPHL
ncbi:hypothetical protein H072_3026 [Dactylellina haptotyla CBS 200.50]|uniref:Uncharacterized protein n=1 Tax=Dactylellina haptotyla (strain CBS 200.50) TaxID=1284197 RepID=S8BTZ2_DACHA|nr:hypothetical protein H072_3026 [Dactylellina haptotyla CBS 200.50]